jgi:hypothetical protein
MQNRNGGTGAQIGFDFGMERAQHRADAIGSDLRHRFELPCSPKNK